MKTQERIINMLMRRTKLTVVTVFCFLFCLPCDAQLEILNPEVLVIRTEAVYESLAVLEITNQGDSTVLFDWRYNIPEELEGYIRLFGHDFNMGYTGFTSTTCGLGAPNVLAPQDTSVFALNIKTKEIIPDSLKHLISQVSLELLDHPDCSNSLAIAPYSLYNPSATKELSEDIIGLKFNPVIDEIYLDKVTVGTLQYQVISVDGQVIQQGVVDQGRISLSIEKPGFYFLNLYNEELRTVIKFLKL